MISQLLAAVLLCPCSSLRMVRVYVGLHCTMVSVKQLPFVVSSATIVITEVNIPPTCTRIHLLSAKVHF